MGTLTKTFVILNLVFSVAFVTISATVLSQRTHWKNKYYGLDEKAKSDKHAWENKEIKYKADLDSIGKERDKANALKDRMTDQLTDRETIIKEKDTRIEGVEKKLAGATAHADRLSQNINRLTSDLQSTRAEMNTAKKELAAARTELDERNTTLVGLRSQIAALELKHKELLHRFNVASARIDAYKKYEDIVERVATAVHARARGSKGAEEGVPEEPIRATVQAVEAESGLVVLNVGASNTPPVKKGYRFLIHRGREFVAAVRVINVEKSMCATEVVPPTPERAVVQVGDAAVTEF